MLLGVDLETSARVMSCFSLSLPKRGMVTRWALWMSGEQEGA